MYFSSNTKAKNICQTLSTTMSECNKNSINAAKKDTTLHSYFSFSTWILLCFCIKIVFPVKYCEKPWKIVLPPLFRKVKYRNNYFWRAWKTPQDEWLLSFPSRRFYYFPSFSLLCRRNVFCAEKYSINLFGNCNPKKSRKWLQNKAVVHCTLKKFAATR